MPAPLCPLCRSSIATDEDEACCAGCQTRYHAECAVELGGCATLGCPRRGQAPQAAQPVEVRITRRSGARPERDPAAAPRRERRRGRPGWAGGGVRLPRPVPLGSPMEGGFGRWLAGTLMLLGVPGFSFVFLYPLLAGPAVLAPLAVLVPLAWWGGHRLTRGQPLGKAATMTLVFSLILLANAEEAHHQLLGDVPLTVASRELPAHPAVDAFRLPDGAVRQELRTSWTTTYTYHQKGEGRRRRTVHRLVAPIAPADWTRDEPVPAWAVWRTGSRPRSWSAQGGLALRARQDLDEYAQAVVQAEAEHRLKSAPGAPLLLWETRREFDRKVRFFWIFLLLGPALWTGGLFLAAGWRWLRELVS